MSEFEHSSLGPSKWDRWVRCPGSVALSKGLPDNAGWEAAEGTAFHHLVAMCAENGLDPLDFVGEGNGIPVEDWFFEYNLEMAESAEEGMYLIETLQDNPKWEVLIEKRVDISPWAGEGQFGSADVIAWNVEDAHIVIFDWKYGQGVPVYPEDCYQLYGYALGGWESFIAFAFDKGGHRRTPWTEIRVDLIIEQPRIAAAGGTHTTTLADVMEMGERAKRALESVDDPESVHPGEHQCSFCPAQTYCRAHEDWMLRICGSEFEDLEARGEESFTLSPALTPTSRSAVLRMAPQIRRWLDRLHAEAFHDAEHGYEVPGFKLVPGRRGRRKWREAHIDLARARLQYRVGPLKVHEPKKLISPAQAEKLVGKREFHEVFSDFVEQGAAKSVLVAESDSREALPSIEDEFDNLDL